MADQGEYLSGVVGADGMIGLTHAQEQADQDRTIAEDQKKYKGKIGLALSTVDRKLQQAIELRESTTSEVEKAKFAAEAERLAKMMTVLELDTGLTSQMNE